MKEIADIDKKAINRPVAELPRTAERDYRCYYQPIEFGGYGGTYGEWQRPIEDACRPGSRCFGEYVYGDELLALRKHESDSCRSVRRLHRVRNVAGMQLVRKLHKLKRFFAGFGQRLGGEGAGDNLKVSLGAFYLRQRRSAQTSQPVGACHLSVNKQGDDLVSLDGEVEIQ